MKVEEILGERLTEAIYAWIKLFENSNENQDKKMIKQILSESIIQENLETPTISSNLSISIHKIIIANQVIFLDPPLEHARVNWISQLHSWLGNYF